MQRWPRLPLREYDVLEITGGTVWVHRDWPECRELLGRPVQEIQALPSVSTVKDGLHAVVIRVPLKTRRGIQCVYYKQYRSRGARGWMQLFTTPVACHVSS